MIVLVVHALPAQEIALLRPLHGGCDIEDILNGIALCQHIAVANPDLDAIPITNPAAFKRGVAATDLADLIVEDLDARALPMDAHPVATGTDQVEILNRDVGYRIGINEVSIDRDQDLTDLGRILRSPYGQGLRTMIRVEIPVGLQLAQGTHLIEVVLAIDPQLADIASLAFIRRGIASVVIGIPQIDLPQVVSGRLPGIGLIENLVP